MSIGSPGFVPEPVEHSQRRASRAVLSGHGRVNYQTKPHLVRYSETKINQLTLELLWILRALLGAAVLFITILLAVLSVSAASSSLAPSEQPWKNTATAFHRSGFVTLSFNDF
jgi:hypothetical protein